MVVVIRLQGLKITAGTEDIRDFFSGLRIPDGGVHIIGGNLEEAFIIFASDEDARRAMTRSGGYIRGSPVNLLLSSKSEMQRLLDESTKKTKAPNRRSYRDDVKRPGARQRSPSLVEGMGRDVQDRWKKDSPSFRNESRSQVEEGGSAIDRIYAYLSGMPFSATREDICAFFDGLQIDDILFFQNKRGTFNGCALVKFGCVSDAVEGMKKDHQYMGSRYVRVLKSSERQWIKLGGFVGSKVQGRRASDQSRSRSPVQRRSRSPVQRRSRSPVQHRSRSPVQHRSRSPVQHRLRSPVQHRSRSPSSEDLLVLYENLSYSTEKRTIKALLQPLSLSDSQITIFGGKNRTKSAVVIFKDLKDYCSGLAHHKEMFLRQVIYASPISKEKMATLVNSAGDNRRSSKSSERSAKSFPDSERKYLYVRNLPFDVRKVEIIDFFHGFQLTEDNVVLLQDEQGAGLGEALVSFQSENKAMMAQALNGQRFLGSELILTCITRTQMREFDVSLPERSSPRNPHRIPFESSDLPNKQAILDNREMMPEVAHQDFGINTPFERFEKPDTYSLNQTGPEPYHNSASDRQFNGPRCVRLLNLPSKIKVHEIYDFCYGYRVVPGSVSLQSKRPGTLCSTATVVFESHDEAVVAVRELNGRPIGTRNVNLVFV